RVVLAPRYEPDVVRLVPPTLSREEVDDLEGFDLDRDADRSEVPPHDLRLLGAGREVARVHHSGLASVAGEFPRASEITARGVEVDISEAGHSRCEVLVRRDRGQGTGIAEFSLTRKSPPVDRVVDGPPQAC